MPTPSSTPTLQAVGHGLLHRIAAGDSDAVALCLDEYGPMVQALARRYLSGHHGGEAPDTEDAVQDIFIEVWRHAARHDPAKGSEASFIATIAHRRLIDRQRKLSSRKGKVLSSEDLGLADGVPHGQATAALGRIIGAAEDVTLAGRAFARLTPDEQDAVWLTICQGISHERVASMLEIPLGTIKTRVRRGLLRLREMLSTATLAEGGAK
jgi:RNA polymerase sigma-70 factor (ECF subfamily)